MIAPKLILSMLSFAVWAAAESEMMFPEFDCDQSNRVPPSFRHRDVISMTVEDKIENFPRKYECTCNGEDCGRLDCRRTLIEINTLTDEAYVIRLAPEPEEVEREVIQLGPIDPIVPDTPLVVLPNEAVTDYCYDATLRRRIPRGETYTKPGSGPKYMGCKCPLTGDNMVVCEELACQMAPSPNPPIPEDMSYRNCFDPWMNQVYLSGTSYNRTRIMSEYQDVVGVYKCNCRYGRTMCNAIDIPCCDATTGEYKGKGERVDVAYRGDKMKCTCFGGRSSYRNCQFLVPDAPTPTTTTPAPTTTTQRPAPGRGSGSRRGQVCTDRYSGRQYRPGTTFMQQRDDGTQYRCRCNFTRSGYLQTSCRRMPN